MLAGTAVTAGFANRSYVSKRYKLNADSISGSFGTLTNLNLPANFHDGLNYDAGRADPDLALNFQLPDLKTFNGNQSTFGAMNHFKWVMADSPFIDGRGDGAGAGSGANTPTGYASTQEPAAIRKAFVMFTNAPPTVSFEQRRSVWAPSFGGSRIAGSVPITASRRSLSRALRSPAAAPVSTSPAAAADGLSKTQPKPEI